MTWQTKPSQLFKPKLINFQIKPIDRYDMALKS